MRSRNTSGSSLMGLAIGLAAGLTVGLLAAPMRGSDMRANLRDRAADGSARLQAFASSRRDWALQALDSALLLVEEGRRAFQTTPVIAEPQRLTATLGEIAQTHGSVPLGLEARS